MAAAGDRRRRLAAATLLQMLLAFFACLLSPASGLRIPHPDLPDMYTDFARGRIWYPPPVEVVAIDLGNTNSCIAGYAPAKTGLTTFQFCIPSWVAFTDDGTTLVGDAARNHAAAHPEDAVFGFKRLLGLSGLSTDSAMIAGKIARLHIVDMVPEPISVAVAYGLRTKLREGANALLLHVGGGTADASIVTLIDRSLGIRAYQDDPFLGGDDFDQKLVGYFAELVKMKHGRDIGGDRIALGKLRAACERAKKALSSQDHVEVTAESLLDGVDFSETLSRSKFEELNDETFRRVVGLVRRVMLEAEERRSNVKIDEIILVGGSTMIPKIQRLVKEYFNGKEPDVRLKPDEAVALGAVVHAYSVY